MIYKYLESKAAQSSVPNAETDAARGRAGSSRSLSSNRCQFRGQPGEDSGGFCRQRSAQRSDRILATRYMAESA